MHIFGQEVAEEIGLPTKVTVKATLAYGDEEQTMSMDIESSDKETNVGDISEYSQMLVSMMQELSVSIIKAIAKRDTEKESEEQECLQKN